MRLRHLSYLVAIATVALAGLGTAGAAPTGRPVSFDLTGSVVINSPQLGDVSLPLNGTADGTIRGNDLELPASGTSFDEEHVSQGGLDFYITPQFNSAFGGTIDTATGALSVTGSMTMNVSIPALGVNGCGFGPTFVELAGNNYNSATGAADLRDDTATVPEVPSTTACGGPGIAPIINSYLGFAGGSTPGQVHTIVTVTATPRIANRVVKGRSVSFQNNAVAAKRGFRWESFDNAVKTNSTDPRAEGATLRVITAQSDSSLSLPPSGWKKVGSAYQYNVSGSKVKVNLSSGKLVVVLKGSAAGFTFTGDPGTVKTVLSLGNESFCAQFGGSRRYLAGQKFVARNAPAPAACPS